MRRTFLKTIKRFGRARGLARGNNSRPNTHHRRLLCEPLEDRRLLSTPGDYFFSQRDSQWTADAIIDVNGTNCGTIGSIGCAMTDVAMLLKHYGLNTDPKQLNTWLNGHNGYAAGGAIDWPKGAEYNAGRMQYESSLSWTSSSIATDNDHWSELKAQLDQGYPVIVKVDAYPSTPALDSHWVLVTAFKGGSTTSPGDYSINDPWDLQFDTNATLARYYDTTYDNTFFATRVYHGTAVTRLPAPTLNSPANDAPNVSTTTGFSWSQVSGNHGYRIIVSTNSADLTTDPEQTGNPSPANGFNETVGWDVTSYTSTGPLSAGMTYYWKVHALAGTFAEAGIWSDQGSFTTAASGITDHQKQQNILGIVNSYRGSLPVELVLGVMRQEGGEGAFHVDGWKYNAFYRQADGAWGQPTNNDGVMQVTEASGHHESRGVYTHDHSGYDHAIGDGCDYLNEVYNASYGGSLTNATLHYNSGPSTLYVYLGLDAGDPQYLSNVASHLRSFVPATFGLQNDALAAQLDNGQAILNSYVNNPAILHHQSADYYSTYQSQLDAELQSQSQDTEAPTVNAFDPQPRSITVGNTVSITYTVSDTGGSGLNRVELWRAPDDDGSQGPWVEVPPQDSISGDGPVSGSFEDEPPSVGGWWYGVHVVDNEQDKTGDFSTEQDYGLGPIHVTVTSTQLPQEITVIGNNREIADGDSSPNANDDTDFGSVAQGQPGPEHTFTVRNDGGETLTMGTVSVPTGFTLTEGLSASLAPDETATFTVRLDTVTSGTKSGQISLTNNDADENPFNFSITGTVNAEGPLVFAGTNGDDAFEFFIRDGQYVVVLNGDESTYAPDEIASIVFDGKAGNDTVTVFDTPDDDTFVFRLGDKTSTALGIDISFLDCEEVIARAEAGGNDEVKLYDTPGDDLFVTTPIYGGLWADGFKVHTQGFDEVRAFATSDKDDYDTAKIFDSPGDDHFKAYPTYVELSGDGFYRYGESFESPHAYATNGGDDVAEFFDSPANDIFWGRAVDGGIIGDGFFARAKHFENIHHYADEGGFDKAKFFDGPGDDQFVAEPSLGTLSYGDPTGGVLHQHAHRFEQVHAYGTAGGHDVANLYDSEADDLFYSDAVEGAMFYPGLYYNRAKFFDEVYGHAENGGDDKAYLFDDPDSADLLEAEGSWARLSNETIDFLHQVGDFDYVTATASNDEDSKNVTEPLGFILDLEGPW